MDTEYNFRYQDDQWVRYLTPLEKAKQDRDRARRFARSLLCVLLVSLFVNILQLWN